MLMKSSTSTDDGISPREFKNGLCHLSSSSARMTRSILINSFKNAAINTHQEVFKYTDDAIYQLG